MAPDKQTVLLQKSQHYTRPVTQVQGMTIIDCVLPAEAIFSDLEKRFWRLLKDIACRRCVRRQEKIYGIGDSAEDIYFVTEGLVMLSTLEHDGREYGQALLPPGNMFGELDVLNDQRRTHQAKALTDTTLWAVRATDFLKSIQESTSLALVLAKLMCVRIRQAECRICDLNSRDVKRRLAQLLLNLSTDAGIRDHLGLHLIPCPTHRDLAIMIFSSRETVSTIMGEFRRDHLIQFDRHTLDIFNEEALSEF